MSGMTFRFGPERVAAPGLRDMLSLKPGKSDEASADIMQVDSMLDGVGPHTADVEIRN